uniref:imm11 family protein n=1 Tax=Corallococcus coralloides TaxID=184914 RepID=UPI000FFEBF95|nr:DUF1629 domain-containing protein [Corallococcus coralloides]
MVRRFYNLTIDVYVPGRWYLGVPIATASERMLDDPWIFSDGRAVDFRGGLRIPIYRPGAPLDFSTAGVGRTPVVNDRLASVFREMAPSDVQLFRATVDGQPDLYHVLNVVRQIRCIDDAACEEVQIRSASEYTERIGEYSSVSGLRIDKSKIGDVRVFRTWGWHSPLIVDDEIKDALEATGIAGGKFEEV